MFNKAFDQKRFDMLSRLISVKACVAACQLPTLWLNAQTAEHLVLANADINAPVNNGSVLYEAVKHNKPDMITVLVALKADPNNRLGVRSCLNEALAVPNSYQLVALLLQCKASINENYGGPTLDYAIHFAQHSQYCSRQVVQLLIDSKADMSGIGELDFSTMSDRPHDMLVHQMNQLQV